MIYGRTAALRNELAGIDTEDAAQILQHTDAGVDDVAARRPDGFDDLADVPHATSLNPPTGISRQT